ncbi:MAG TPA: ATP-dependent helicase [Gemmatimonadales bacterium]|nr:ATP-dependent helicase [Gemmatimonadales bacterium]
MPAPAHPFERLNPNQRAAAEYGTQGLPRDLPGPLLIIAGAGTGKTSTLAHRVAQLLVMRADPRRILLLTFTRRAAETMTRRAQRIAAHVAEGTTGPARIQWSGTFHAMASRLLRLHAAAVGLDAGFTVLDRSDAADLMNLVRQELGLSLQATRFPTKGTCLAIYSHAVNAGAALDRTLERAFPAYGHWTDELKRLFRAYVDAKQRRHLLDYDDLLLYWFHLMQDPVSAEAVRRRFDHVLVDEYQDTNALQAGILLGLKPDGRGLTVVGDDAQAIYAFRAATVRNIRDFPHQFDPPAHVVTLEQNYRSTQPILDAANAVMALAAEGFPKRLYTTRASEQRPLLVAVRDEQAEADYVVERVLAHREAGIALKRQAVLMRTAHHSDVLEVELGRRNIPFVKFGGLKFLEAAHVKDVLCVLRWAENPRDEMAAFRVLQLLPGLGPASARRVLDELEQAAFDLAVLTQLDVPAAARVDWPAFGELLGTLHRAAEWPGQLGAVRQWYEPYLERLYEAPHVRIADLEQLERLAGDHASRESFLTDLTLDPPSALGDEAGQPLLDEDYLILSTIHSAKGQEWDAVYVLHVVDGCIPSDMATGTPDEIEEERRLLYVAMTRARDSLYVLQPHRFYTGGRPNGDAHVYAPRTRFIPATVAELFEGGVAAPRAAGSDGDAALAARVDVAARLKEMWR